MADNLKTTLTDEQAEALVEDLLDEHGRYSPENDAIAAALVRIIDLFAYEQDFGTRDTNATTLRMIIYLHTSTQIHG